MKYASLKQRGGAFLIDSLIILSVIGIATALVIAATPNDDSYFNPIPTLVNIVFQLTYFVGMEGTWGATVGKLVMNTRVVSLDGSPITYRQAIRRNLFNLVDSLGFGLVGAYLISRSPLRQRFGDRVAKTVVVSN